MTTIDPSGAVGSAEARALHLGLRRAFRLRLPRQDVARWQRAVTRRGWHLAVSDRAIADIAGGAWHGATAGAVVAAGAGDANQLDLRLCVVAGAAADAAQALAIELAAIDRTALTAAADSASLVADHRALGQLYGYPACCIEAFIDAHLEVLAQLAPRVGDNLVAITRAAERSQRFWPQLDAVAAFHFAPMSTPLRHMPCRFDCPASLDLVHRLTDQPPVEGSHDHCAALLLLANGAIARFTVGGAEMASLRTPQGAEVCWMGSIGIVGVGSLDDGDDSSLSRYVGAMLTLHWSEDGAASVIDSVGHETSLINAATASRTLASTPSWRRRLPCLLPFAAPTVPTTKQPPRA